MNEITKSLIKERGGRPCDSSPAFTEINLRIYILCRMQNIQRNSVTVLCKQCQNLVYYHKTEHLSLSARTWTCMWDARHQVTKTSLSLVVASLAEVQEKLFCGPQQLGSPCGPRQPQQHFCFKRVFFLILLSLFVPKYLFYNRKMVR